MTTSESLARELDAAIAWRLGWRLSPVSNFIWQMVPPNGDGFHVESCPKYSTDLIAAFALRDTMKQKGFDDFALVFASDIWMARFRRTTPPRWHVDPMWGHAGATPAEAISRAALSTLRTLPIDSPTYQPAPKEEA